MQPSANSQMPKPETPITIKIFFQTGWAIIGLALIIAIVGIVQMFSYDTENSTYSWPTQYMSHDEGWGFNFIGFLLFLRDIAFFGIFPGLILVGLGFHLKKTWESSHYPW